MSDKLLIELLIKFFREEFAEDAAGVGEWIEGQGEDPDEFVAALDLLDFEREFRAEQVQG